MLEDYQSLLARLRQDGQTWSEVAHQAIFREEGQMEDPHYRQRYGVLLCMQYDRREEDDKLLRYLLAEETKSRSNDPFQGESSALLLAAYLVACRCAVEDVWLLWEAKSANFDTSCALDSTYLFTAGIDATLDYLKASDRTEAHDILECLLEETAGPLVPTPEQMENFWQQKRAAYPTDPAQENTLVRVQQAWELDQIEEARRLLDRWQAEQSDIDQNLHTLMYTRAMLGQPVQALACARRLLEMSAGDFWQHASAQFDVGRYAVAAGAYEQAWEMLAQILESLRISPERRFLGQEIATLELALSIGQAAPTEHPLRRPALQQAHEMIEQGFSSSYNILKGMCELAQALEDTALEKRYRKLAEKEHRRIQRLP